VVVVRTKLRHAVQSGLQDVQLSSEWDNDLIDVTFKHSSVRLEGDYV